MTSQSPPQAESGNREPGGPGAEELEEKEVLCSWGPRAMGFSSAVSMVAVAVLACIVHRQTIGFRGLCVSPPER